MQREERNPIQPLPWRKQRVIQANMVYRFFVPIRKALMPDFSDDCNHKLSDSFSSNGFQFPSAMLSQFSMSEHYVPGINSGIMGDKGDEGIDFLSMTNNRVLTIEL